MDECCTELCLLKIRMATKIEIEDKKLANASGQEQHKHDEVSTSSSAPEWSPSPSNSTELALDESAAVKKRGKQKLQQYKETKHANNKNKIFIGAASSDSVDDEENRKEQEESDQRKLKEKDEVIANLKRGLEENLKKQEETTKALVLLCQRKRKDKDEIIANLQSEFEAYKEEVGETVKGKDEVIANLERELQKCKKDLNETLIEFGRMLVENDRKVTEERAESIFEETFKSGVANISSTLSEISQLPKAAQLPQVDEASTLAAAMQTLEVKSPNNVEIQPPVLVEPSVQESEEESSSSYKGNYASLQRSVSSRKINNPSRNTRNAGIEATSSSATIDRAGLIVTNGVAPNKYGEQSEASNVFNKSGGGRRPSQSSSTQRREPQVVGSNGSKLSKFAREDSSRHRNRSPQDSNVKCVNCGTEQEFTERSQFCRSCVHTNLAEYFCAFCKCLIGKCDTCSNVCCDVQCRDDDTGSVHDKCCICFEDVFTGYQISPCSHKVHKECASPMIPNGIIYCQICLENLRPPRKHDGK